MRVVRVRAWASAIAVVALLAVDVAPNERRPTPLPGPARPGHGPGLEGASQVRQYPTPTKTTILGSITYGSGGRMWFTETTSGKIGAVAPDGRVTEYPTSSPGSVPEDIVRGPDGRMWFSEQGMAALGAITGTGVVRNYEPVSVASGPGNTIWFTEDGVPSIGVIQAEPEGLRVYPDVTYRDVTAPEPTSGRRSSL